MTNEALALLVPPYPDRTYRHFSLDLETFSFEPNAAIFTVGLIAFEPVDGTFGPSLHVRVDGSTERQGHVSRDTVDWWAHPDQAKALEVCVGLPPVPAGGLRKIVAAFLSAVCPTYPDDPKSLTVWAMGSEFDPVILNAHCRRHGESDVLHRKSLGDCRTLLKMFPGIPKFVPDLPHVALEDAIAQASLVGHVCDLDLGFNPMRNL